MLRQFQGLDGEGGSVSLEELRIVLVEDIVQRISSGKIVTVELGVVDNIVYLLLDASECVGERFSGRGLRQRPPFLEHAAGIDENVFDRLRCGQEYPGQADGFLNSVQLVGQALSVLVIGGRLSENASCWRAFPLFRRIGSGRFGQIRLRCARRNIRCWFRCAAQH